jgi:hypothetical protein
MSDMNQMNEANEKRTEARLATHDDQRAAAQHREGRVALSIEHQTAKLPSDLFLWGAIGAIAASAVLQIRGRREISNFVGQWAPTLLTLGVYNKIVKVMGSDRAGGEAMAADSDPMTLH